MNGATDEAPSHSTSWRYECEAGFAVYEAALVGHCEQPIPIGAKARPGIGIYPGQTVTPEIARQHRDTSQP